MRIAISLMRCETRQEITLYIPAAAIRHCEQREGADDEHGQTLHRHDFSSRFKRLANGASMLPEKAPEMAAFTGQSLHEPLVTRNAALGEHSAIISFCVRQTSREPF